MSSAAIRYSALRHDPGFLLGGRTSASAERRHWSGRAVRWSSCAILLSFVCRFPGHAIARSLWVFEEAN